MSQRKKVKWTIERVSHEDVRGTKALEARAAEAPSQNYPTLAQMREASPMMRSKMADAVQRFFAPVVLASVIATTGCLAPAQAQDRPHPPAPANDPPPLGGVPRRPHYDDPPPPPPPPPPPAQHPRPRHQTPNPAPTPNPTPTPSPTPRS